jgi:hypothetical protein
MKKVLIPVLFTIVLLNLIASISSSQPKKKSIPDGFIGLKWGNSLEKMKEEGLLNWVQTGKEIPNHAGAYINLNKFNPYPNLKIKGILLFFYKDNLFGGEIHFVGKEAWNILSETIEEEYGTPQIQDVTNAKGERTAKILRWHYGSGKSISSVFYEVEDKGNIQFYFEPKELRDELDLWGEKRRQQKK